MMFVVRRTLWKALAATIIAIVSELHPLIHREISLVCADGTTLAAQSWQPSLASSDPQSEGTRHTRHILCLHGWLDNCRSFYQLSPALVAKVAERGNYHVVALDLPGHGRSSHKSIDAPPMVQAEMVFYVSEAIHELYEKGIWKKQQQQQGDAASPGTISGTAVTLIGHSLGAAIASLYASSFPEHMDQLILLDGAGFWSPHHAADDLPLHVRNHVRRRMMTLRKTKTKTTPSTTTPTSRRTRTRTFARRGYPTLDAAIRQRLQSVTAMPGNQTLSYDVARQLVLRAMHMDHFNDNGQLTSVLAESTTTTTTTTTTSTPLVFRHDTRYAWPSIQYITQAQNEGIFRKLGESQIDTCILLAEEGWPFRQEFIDKAVELIRPRRIQTLPGSHYMHADAATAPGVVDAILQFLSKTTATGGNEEDH